jgi:hypothetical protein
MLQSFETLVNIYQSTWQKIPKDLNLLKEKNLQVYDAAETADVKVYT